MTLCVRACMRARMRVLVCACVHACMRACVCACSSRRACAHACLYMPVGTLFRKFVPKLKRPRARCIYAHAVLRVSVHMSMHMRALVQLVVPEEEKAADSAARTVARCGSPRLSFFLCLLPARLCVCACACVSSVCVRAYLCCAVVVRREEPATPDPKS